MKITGVEPFHINVPYDYGNDAATAHTGMWRTMETLFVKVTTDEGPIGWGEAFGFNGCALTRSAIADFVAPLCIGHDATDIAGLSTLLQKRLHSLGRNGPIMHAISGIDIALWDIRGKIAGKPLHQLIGDANRTQLEAYASLLRYNTPELVSQTCEAAIARGYKHVKLHESGLAEIEAARRTIGDTTPLMVDTNCRWSVDEAIAAARSFQSADLLWLEEPVWPPEDVAGLARVRREGHVPLACGENTGTPADFARLIAADAVDYIQPSVTKAGGVTGMLEVVELARRNGVAVAPHSPYFGPGLIATIHLLAALPEERPCERFYCDLEASPLGDAVNAHDGFMRVPSAPGLGVDVDETILGRYRID